MPIPVRRTWIAFPAQLNRRENRFGAAENWSGRFAMPLLGSPVTAATPRTAPFVQRCCTADEACTRSPTAKAEPPRAPTRATGAPAARARAGPPSAKKRATSASAVAGLNVKRLPALIWISFRSLPVHIRGRDRFPPTPDDIAEPRRGFPGWSRRLLGGGVTLAVTVAVFVFFLPKIADYRDVWDVIRELTWREGLLLAGVTALNLATFAPPWMAALPGPRFRQALVLTHALAAPPIA